MTRAFAMIMAGGSSEHLSILTETRAEPAVPFGGKFRLIDFPLSNCVNSDIINVAVLTQYKPRGLNNHIGIGKPWDLDRASGGVRLLQPYTGGVYGDWQKGTADAVRRNLDFVKQQSEEHVLILAGDHIYLMDYRAMLRQHLDRDADLTVATHRINQHDAHRYGNISLGPNDRILSFEEKPKRAAGPLASMGIYIFRKEVLIDVLEAGNHIDFGRDLLPAMLGDGDQGKSHQIHGYRFPGYWADVGTVQAYWEANMALLSEEPALDLYDPEWVVHTRSLERAPVKMGSKAQVAGNLISNGCRIEGRVERSVLSPGVFVEQGAVVRDSIVLSDTVIHAGAVVDRCIVDRDVTIGTNAKVGHGEDNAPNKTLSEVLNTGLTLIGRNSSIPPEIVIGRNVVVHTDSDAATFGKRKRIASGSDIGVDLR